MVSGNYIDRCEYVTSGDGGDWTGKKDSFSGKRLSEIIPNILYVYLALGLILIEPQCGHSVLGFFIMNVFLHDMQ